MDVKGTVEASLLTMASKKAEASALKESRDAAKLKKSCTDFEGIFMNTMYQAMQKTVEKSGFFGDGFQKDMFESLFMEKIFGQIAETRGMGLGETMYQQLSAKMEALKSPSVGAGQALKTMPVASDNENKG